MRFWRMTDGVIWIRAWKTLASTTRSTGPPAARRRSAARAPRAPATYRQHRRGDHRECQEQQLGANREREFRRDAAGSAGGGVQPAHRSTATGGAGGASGGHGQQRRDEIRARGARRVAVPGTRDGRRGGADRDLAGAEELAQRSGDVLQAGPVDRVVDANGLQARIQITPSVIGQNRIAVQLPGTDPSIVERVQLTFTYLDEQFGSTPLVLPARQPSPALGRERAAAIASGHLASRAPGAANQQDDARTAVRFLVSGFGGAAQQPVAATGTYPLLPSPMYAIAYLLLAAGVVVIVVGFARTIRRPRRNRRALQRQAALLGAGILVLACGGYVYAQEQRNSGVPLDVANIRDPIAPDEQSLASGEEVYTTYCLACHGESGRGDGPAGLRLVRDRPTCDCTPRRACTPTARCSTG